MFPSILEMQLVFVINVRFAYIYNKINEKITVLTLNEWTDDERSCAAYQSIIS